MLMVDLRQVLTADPRDALLSLKQISLDFPAGTTPAQATELASKFTTATGAISGCGAADQVAQSLGAQIVSRDNISMRRSEEHTSELQSLMRISYADFCLKKKNINIKYIR